MTETAPTGPGTRRMPIEALLWAVGCYVGGYVIGSILAGVAIAAGDSSTGAVTTFVGEIGLWSGMVAAAVVVCRRYGTGSLRADLGYRIGFGDVWPGLGAAVVGLVAAQLLSILFEGTRFAGTNTQIITGQEHHGGLSFALVTVIVAVGAPAFEELFFRGAIRSALGTFGSHGAIWGQAVLFGLAHFQPSAGLKNVSVMVIVGSLGVVLGYTARATRRLGPGIIAHGLFNSIQVALVLS